MPAWRTSDTSIAGAVEALRGVQAVSRHFHGFDDYEVRVLAKAMSMVEFHEGDSIIEKGETASWFGVLLSGTVHAVIAPDLRFPIHRGEILGEQSLFSQPSTRSASVVGATAGMMGLFTFDELAAFVQDAPALGLRLVSLLGHASAEKLDAERAIAVRDARPAPMAPAWKQLKQPTELLRLFTEVAGRSRDLSTLSAADEHYRTEVIKLGLSLKSHGSLKTLVQEILNLELYQTRSQRTRFETTSATSARTGSSGRRK